MRLMSSEEAVHAYYRDRLTNDPDLLRDWFTQKAFISFNGSGLAKTESPDLCARRRAGEDPEAVTKLCHYLISRWHWHGYDLLQVVADRQQAASRVLIDIEYLPTGTRLKSEIAEFTQFNGERFTQLISFFDTDASAAMKGER